MQVAPPLVDRKNFPIFACFKGLVLIMGQVPVVKGLKSLKNKGCNLVYETGTHLAKGKSKNELLMTNAAYMEKMITSMDDKVDYYLQKIATAPALRMHPLNLYEAEIMNEDVYILDQVMLEKGLIKIEKEWRVVTGKGLEIANFGGWAAYQRQRTQEVPRRMEVLDPVNKKLQKEIGLLKQEIESLNRELELRNDRDRNSSMIIQNLIRQSKNVKVMLLVGGFITGFSLAILLWLMLLQ